MKENAISHPPTPPDGRGADSRSTIRQRLASARFDRAELAGSLGDLGTFLPLLVGMSAQNGLSFASALFFAGLFNVVTGLMFTIPMAVQPMKAIAAVALTEGMTAHEILAAGAAVGATILLLGLTGLIDALNRLVPKSVVRGLQLALGLKLLVKAMEMIAGTGAVIGPDSYSVAVLATLVVLALFFSRRVPAALLLFTAGIALAIWKRPEVLGSISVGVSLPVWDPPAWGDFATSFAKAVIPQIPLTTLNSVIAVCALSRDLFPGERCPPRRVAVSVGLMNLVSVWFGGMPMCHGAGGLAGQYRFGARTNGSILFLGLAKLLIAIFFGASLMATCEVFPASILGVMLGFAGMELSMVARDQTSRTDAFAMLLTTGAILGLNIAAGLLIGLALIGLLRYGPFHVEERNAPNG